MRPDYSAPFDQIAKDYDAAFTETAVGRMQREIVWRFLAQWKKAQNQQTLHVLELNCGTGEDALWLARQGCQVLATDISPAMVAITRAKADQAGLSNLISTQVLDIQDVSFISTNKTKTENTPSTVHRSPSSVHRPPSTGFDLIFSNFGGLNCVPPESLKNLGNALPKLLKPGGYFIAVVMGRFCWWETLYFLFKGKFRTAFRRLSQKSVVANLDGKSTIKTWYYSPKSIKKIAQTAPSVLQAVGFWLPPSYLNPFFGKRPRLLAVLNTLEQKCRNAIYTSGADHFLICLQNQKP